MTAILRPLVVAALVFSVGCSGTDNIIGPGPMPAASSSPAGASSSAGGSASPVAAPAPSTTTGTFPAVTGPARVYGFASSVGYEVSATTRGSRFVLYDDGTFALQFLSPVGEYKGKYSVTGRVLNLQWEGWSVAGAWESDATLDGDTLTIRYGLIMALTDFEDAVYKRVP